MATPVATAACQGQNQTSQNSRTVLKVVILGNEGVGKSSLMNRFVENRFDENPRRTIGIDFLTKDIEVDGEAYTLQIWDSAGQENNENMKRHDFKDSDICMLTYSIDNHASFDSLETCYEEFLQYANVKEGSAILFLVVGNKLDKTDERKVFAKKVADWCLKYKDLPMFETSAKDATNIEEIFTQAVKMWSKQQKKLDTQGRELPSGEQPKQRKPCCLY